jgi:hypothetical protein
MEPFDLSHVTLTQGASGFVPVAAGSHGGTAIVGAGHHNIASSADPEPSYHPNHGHHEHAQFELPGALALIAVALIAVAIRCWERFASMGRLIPGRRASPPGA